jgi:hypothetical protein
MPRAGLQERLDVRLAGRREQAVARYAPGPRRKRRGEPVQDIAKLVISFRAAYVGTEPQAPAAEQAAVLGQQHSPARVGRLDQRVVIGVVGVRGIHADQSQPAGQLAQVDIEDEPGRRHGLRPADGADLGYAPGSQPVAKSGRPAVDPQAVGLGQRDAEGLDEVAE